MRARVLVVGGGLAGSEAAWQLAEAGVDVVLAEMRPTRTTPVHGGNLLAELVCSNSLRGDAPTNAVGVLKAEMEALDSLIVRIARQAAVPAGGALAVDRDVFARGVTTAITEHARITVDRREVVSVPPGPAIIATGPLTSPALHRALNEELGNEALSHLRHAFFRVPFPYVLQIGDCGLREAQLGDGHRSISGPIWPWRRRARSLAPLPDPRAPSEPLA